jgi:hypothetical protein
MAEKANGKGGLVTRDKPLPESNICESNTVFGKNIVFVSNVPLLFMNS